MAHLQGDIGWEININAVINATLNGERSLSISSNGGSLYEGWGIHDYIKANDIVDSIVCYGMVASSATIVMAAAKNRIGSPNSQYVIHNPWTMAVGDAERMAKVAGELQADQERLINFYVGLTGKEYDYIKNLLAEERPLTANEALELGLITEIINFENMADEKKMTEALNKFETSLLSKIQNLFKGSGVKNMVVQSTSGEELEFDAGVETSEQIVVGGGLKSNGEPANGEFVLADGTKVKAENGIITEVTPKPLGGEDAEMDALKTELEATKAQLTEAQNKLATELSKAENLTKELNTARNAIGEIQNEFKDFKNQFVDEKIPGNIPPASQQKTSFAYSRKKD